EIEEGEGWGWLEMRLGKGRVILCNFAIIEKWDKGPVPRFLLREILEYTQTAEGIIKSMLP
ncbi:MAG: hypothetical protein GX811_09235, partial [Lentisphaerae bacterium]|nr:hypothetical protein [Lentisphaerota bacterium]